MTAQRPARSQKQLLVPCAPRHSLAGVTVVEQQFHLRARGHVD